MLFGLNKLFGKGDRPADAPANPPPATAPAGDGPRELAYVRRDTIFDQQQRPAGYIFHLRHLDASHPNLPASRQRPLDDALLKSLCLGARDESWGRSLSFVPLSSVSLDNPGLDRLPVRNTVILLTLGDETNDPQAAAQRLAGLRQRGLRFCIFRQPVHPVYLAALPYADFAAIDVAANGGENIRNFSVAVRSEEIGHPLRLLATNIETSDDHQLCRRWQFDLFQGPFAQEDKPLVGERADPHKLHLLHLLNLVQSEAETNELAEGLKQDPMLTYRILRYLNSAAVGLYQPISSIDQALIMLGRQRLARWLSVLLFSVKDPDFGDWLLVESALSRGRIMELLGKTLFPPDEHDLLFITGVFSKLDRLLHAPLAEALDRIHLPETVRAALLERRGPYAPLLAVAEAGEAYDHTAIEVAAQIAGVTPDRVNEALLAALSWVTEVTEHWE